MGSGFLIDALVPGEHHRVQVPDLDILCIVDQSGKTMSQAISKIDHLLSQTAHRPFALPAGRWCYYQEWNRALFLHWRVPSEVLRPLVPPGLHIDTIEGHAYVSLVAFTMEGIRPRGLPGAGFVSDFDEINVRTYVAHGGRHGVYFLSIEAGKLLSTWLARVLSGLPYQKADICRTDNSYRSVQYGKGFHFNVTFETGKPIRFKTGLDLWLTERYCLYLDRRKNLFRYDIHHQEWPIQSVDLSMLAIDYRISGVQLYGAPDALHYAEGVQVLAWPRQLCC